MYIAAAIIMVLAGFFWASYSIRSGVYVRALCRARTTEKVVALTFDDGPDPVQTPLVLDILKEHGIKAAFFVIGSKAAANPAIIRRMEQEGHLVGNHTYSHRPAFPLWSSRRMAEDMCRGDDAIEEATGRRPAFFRPPYGVTNPMVARAVKRQGYRVVGWSIRSLDTTARAREKVLRRITRRLGPGRIILLHDDRPRSEELLTMLLGELKNNGYTATRADKMMGL